MKPVELYLESLIFKSRWILAPFFLGLILAIIALLIKFSKELYNLVSNIFTLSSDQSIISILTLVDTTLIASLLLIIIFSGYENFVSKIAFGDHEDRPEPDREGRRDIRQGVAGLPPLGDARETHISPLPAGPGSDERRCARPSSLPRTGPYDPFLLTAR